MKELIRAILVELAESDKRVAFRGIIADGKNLLEAFDRNIGRLRFDDPEVEFPLRSPADKADAAEGEQAYVGETLHCRGEGILRAYCTADDCEKECNCARPDARHAELLQWFDDGGREMDGVSGG